MRLLVLGGTAEARELAGLLHQRIEVISSLAGRIADPALPPGEVRIGGFGGADGLRNWLAHAHIDAVVDATHPFAATITTHAAQACKQLGMPHLVLHRPPWDAERAALVGSDVEAAQHVAAKGYERVFLTTGRSGAAAFRDSKAWFLIRVVTAPDPAGLPAEHRLLFSRGPYRYDDEYALMSQNNVDVLVTKNSGGVFTRAKLDAARELGIDVVMIRRPELPDGLTTVASVSEAQQWVLSRDNGAE